MQARMKIAVILILCLLVCSFASCGSDPSVSANGNAVKENESTTIDSNGGSITLIGDGTSDPPPETTVTEPVTYTPITNPFNGNIDFIDKTISRTYRAPRDGIYRFDFDFTSNVNASISFTIFDLSKREICNTTIYGHHNTPGTTVALTGGTIYNIIFKYNHEYSTFTMKIGEPHPTVTIHETSIADSISYIDQENLYTYTAPKTGRYRIECTPSDDTVRYDFIVFDSTNKQLCDNYSNGADGYTLDLVENQTYQIILQQINGISYTYSLKIHVPHAIQAVTGKKITDSTEFTDQQNIYTFSVPATGTYAFHIETTDATASISIDIQNEKKESVATKRVSSSETEFKAELTANQTYKIYIAQKEGFCNYTVTFHQIAA